MGKLGKHLRSWFFTGLFVLLPVTLTLWLLVWGFNKFDSILGNLFYRYFELRIPGLGFVTLSITIILTGAIAHHYIGKIIITWVEKLIRKIPVLGSIFNLFKQFADGLVRVDPKAFRKVVLVEYPRRGIFSPGFITSDAPEEVTDKTGQKLVSVFIPTVPNPTTGFLFFVPAEEVICLDISIEDGFKLLVTAGVIKPKK